MLWITIDPGATTGWAIWDVDRLLRCGSCAPREVPAGSYLEAVIEWPQERTHGRKIGVASLLVLAGHAGEALATVSCAHQTRYFPAQWKRGVPKPMRNEPYIIAERVAKRLHPDEPRPPSTARELDTWDAIGLGLVHCGRALPGVV